MNFSSTIISSLSWSHLKWFHTFLFFFLFFSAISVCSSTPPKISYSDHCASIIPQANPTDRDYTHPFLRTKTIHFTGGETIFGNNSSVSYFESHRSLSFGTTRNVYKTDTIGVYKIEATLIFRASTWYVDNSTYDGSYTSRRRRRLFLLDGFWSESSGKLCMVGSASGYSGEGKLHAVLKLNHAYKNSTIFTSLISGSLESLSSRSDPPSYFEPVSILAFSEMSNYKYTMVSEGFNKSCSGGIDVPPSSSRSLQQTGFCQWLSEGFNTFKLEYSSKCNPLKNCTPFGDGIGYLPHLISLHRLQCSEDENSLRYLIEFSEYDSVMYNQPFDPKTTLVAEGSWDGNKNRLCIVACRILTDSLGNTHVGDCSTRLSFRYPAIWSIGNSFDIVGEIWTNKTSNNSEYFNRIQFRSSSNNIVDATGLKYEYTQIDKVRRSCPVTKPLKNKWEKYPDGHSYDMRFDMSVKNRNGRFAWGYVYPIFVGSQFYEQYSVHALAPLQAYSVSEEEEKVSVVETNTAYSGPLNISYMISLDLLYGMKWDSGMSSLNFSSRYNRQVEIFAEGVYDAETGQLCMVGCRKLQFYSQKSINDSVDCEILVNFQFSPVNGGSNGGFIEGSIKSMRKSTDLLYFELLNISSNAYYATEAKKSIWRMDLEIALVLISNTLACLFVVFQLFYVRKHPDVLPSISVVMLVILTLGYMIPLVLNFDALFLGYRNQQNVLVGSGGWIEANEVIVRVVTMIAFLLQFRLLQRVWSARSSNESQKGLWIAEMKSVFVSLPLYVVGVLAALFVNWRKNEYVDMALSSRAYIHHQHSLWGDLKSYGGLILDGFLFPQILLNIFRISRENVLSPSFYFGTTSVRVLPHAYDLYRMHNYVPQHANGSYIYANPSADFYSTSWDIIIPFGGMLFAAIIYLQQRFGGRCILPQRFRKPEMYEQVPELAMN